MPQLLITTYLQARSRMLRQMRRGTQLCVLSLALAGCGGTPQSAERNSPLVSPCNRLQAIDLPAQRLDATVQALADASGCFVASDMATSGATPVSAVHGELSIAAALSRALRGTGLSLVQQGNTLTVH